MAQVVPFQSSIFKKDDKYIQVSVISLVSVSVHFNIVPPQRNKTRPNDSRTALFWLQLLLMSKRVLMPFTSRIRLIWSVRVLFILFYFV